MLYELQKIGAEDGSQQPSQTILVDNSDACEKNIQILPKANLVSLLQGSWRTYEVHEGW